MGEAAGDKKHPKGVRSHQRMCVHEGTMVLMEFLSVFSQDRGEVGFMGGRGNIVLYKVFSVMYTEYGHGLVIRDEHGAVN